MSEFPAQVELYADELNALILFLKELQVSTKLLPPVYRAMAMRLQKKFESALSQIRGGK